VILLSKNTGCTITNDSGVVSGIGSSSDSGELTDGNAIVSVQY